MDEKTRQLVFGIKKNLLTDLPKFLENPKDFALAKKIEGYCTDALSDLEGLMDSDSSFSEFVNILFGCQQLDDFGESWAPTTKKIGAWIIFLKKFVV